MDYQEHKDAIVNILEGLNQHEVAAWMECKGIFGEIPEEDREQVFIELMTNLTVRGIPVNTAFIQGLDEEQVEVA